MHTRPNDQAEECVKALLGHSNCGDEVHPCLALRLRNHKAYLHISYDIDDTDVNT